MKHDYSLPADVHTVSTHRIYSSFSGFTTSFCSVISRSTRIIACFAILFILGIGQTWGAITADGTYNGYYSARVISNSGKTSTWTYASYSWTDAKAAGNPLVLAFDNSSNQKWTSNNTQFAKNTEYKDIDDNGMIYYCAGGDFKYYLSSNAIKYFYVKGNGRFYIPVPAGSSGTVSVTIGSSKEKLWLDLYHGDVVDDGGKRLFSRASSDGKVDANQKTGPTSFNFTSTDITTYGGKTYLKFILNTTLSTSEYCPNSFTVTLTNGSYIESSGGTEPPTYTISTAVNPADAGSVSADVALTGKAQGDEITFTATPADGYTFSSWSVDGEGLFSGNVFTVGAGNATITANFTKATPEQSSDATLSDLKVNGSTVSGFASTTYTYDLGELTAKPTSVTGTASHSEAAVGTATIGDTQATITVTAEDGSTKTYTLNYTIKATTGGESGGGTSGGCEYDSSLAGTGTYSVRTISDGGKTSTWSWNPAGNTSSNQSLNGKTDNEVVYIGSEVKANKSGYLSVKGTGSIYLPVLSGSAGTISMVTTSTSDGRWLQLYIDGTSGTTAQRLWSKSGTDGTNTGPQSFDFTADDITTYNGNTYLHFKDNDTEMKIGSISITLNCAAKCTSITPTISYDDTDLLIDEQSAVTLGGNTGNGAVTWSVSENDFVSINASTGAITALKAGSATVTVTATIAEVEKDGVTYCQTTKTQEVTFNITCLNEAVALYAPDAISVAESAVIVDFRRGNHTGTEISYSSDDETVITIDANGKITPHKAGTATITATVKAAGKYCEATVTKTIRVATGKYYYRGEDNSWGATPMNKSKDGYYEYYESQSQKNYHKITESCENWNLEYTRMHVVAGHQGTNITDCKKPDNAWGEDDQESNMNCAVYYGDDYNAASTKYYILIYYPNTKANTNASPVICYHKGTLPEYEDYYNTAGGATVYFNNHDAQWTGEKLYFRIGRKDHNSKVQMSLVLGTQNLYRATVPAYDNYLAYHIANNGGWSDNNSVYKTNTGDGWAITEATDFMKREVGSTEIFTITPDKSWLDKRGNTEALAPIKGEEDIKNNCLFFPSDETAGMLSHNASITAPSNGMLTVTYTKTDGTAGQSLTTDPIALAHTCILTITAEPADGYRLKAITVNDTEIATTASATHILTADAEISAVFEVNTTTEEVCTTTVYTANTTHTPAAGELTSTSGFTKVGFNWESDKLGDGDYVTFALPTGQVLRVGDKIEVSAKRGATGAGDLDHLYIMGGGYPSKDQLLLSTYKKKQSVATSSATDFTNAVITLQEGDPLVGENTIIIPRLKYTESGVTYYQNHYIKYIKVTHAECETINVYPCNKPTAAAPTFTPAAPTTNDVVVLTSHVSNTVESAQLEYQWYKDGIAISGATAATYNATHDAAGTFAYHYTVQDRDCDPVTSNSVSVEVTKAKCVDEAIATITKINNKTATVDQTGQDNGFGYACNLQGSKVGGSNQYLTITGDFNKGDKIQIVLSAGADATGVLYVAKGGHRDDDTYATFLSQPAAAAGTYTFTLTEDFDNATAITFPREIDGKTNHNPTFTSVTVIRCLLPEVKDIYDFTNQTFSYCDAVQETTLTLSGSTRGVDYILYNGDTPVGSAVAGTGEALTWSVSVEGTYTVRTPETDDYRSTLMNGTAIVEVTPKPCITTQPVGKEYYKGETMAALTIVAENATGYQWYENTAATTTQAKPIADAINDSYTPTKAGFYYCVVSGCGEVISNIVSIAIKDNDATHPATTTPGSVTFLDVKNTTANGYISSDASAFMGDSTLTYGARYILDEAKNGGLGKPAWYEGTTNASNKDTQLSDYAALGYVKTSTTTGNIGHAAVLLKNDAHATYFVTGAHSVGISKQDNGTSDNKWIVFTVQEVNANGENIGAAVQVNNPIEPSTNLVSLEYGLDPARYYKITVSSAGGSNSYLYAVRFSKQITTINVTYDANGGVGSFMQKPDKNTTFTVASFAATGIVSPIPTDEWGFAGWNTKANGTGDAYAEGSDCAAGETAITLYAQWEKTCNDRGFVLDYTTTNLLLEQSYNTARPIYQVNGDDITANSFTWTSSNPAVATVAADGTVTAHAEGTTVITATLPLRNGYCSAEDQIIINVSDHARGCYDEEIGTVTITAKAEGDEPTVDASAGLSAKHNLHRSGQLDDSKAYISITLQGAEVFKDGDVITVEFATDDNNKEQRSEVIYWLYGTYKTSFEEYQGYSILNKGEGNRFVLTNVPANLKTITMPCLEFRLPDGTKIERQKSTLKKITIARNACYGCGNTPTISIEGLGDDNMLTMGEHTITVPALDDGYNAECQLLFATGRVTLQRNANNTYTYDFTTEGYQQLVYRVYSDELNADGKPLCDQTVKMIINVEVNACDAAPIFVYDYEASVVDERKIKGVNGKLLLGTIVPKSADDAPIASIRPVSSALGGNVTLELEPNGNGGFDFYISGTPNVDDDAFEVQKDENGDIIYETDKAGNVLETILGEPIPLRPTDFRYNAIVEVTNGCNPAKTFTLTIPIRVLRKDVYRLAYVVEGDADTEVVDAKFTDYRSSQAEGTKVFDGIKAINDVRGVPGSRFVVEAVNAYASIDKNEILDFYSDFDIIVLSDWPNSKQKDFTKTMTYSDALGWLIDYRPMLSFEVFVADLDNWHLNSTPLDPTINDDAKVREELGMGTDDPIDDFDRYAAAAAVKMDVLCTAHSIFSGGAAVNVNSPTLDILTGHPKNYEGGERKGLQGFAMMDVSDYMFIATIDGKDAGTLVTCCERQVNPAARCILWGVNHSASEHLSDQGGAALKYMLDYLLEDDLESLSDCSMYFDNGAGNKTSTKDDAGDNLWSNPANWGPAYNTLPTLAHKTRIEQPCVVDIPYAQSSQLTLRKGQGNTHETDNEGNITIPNGATREHDGTITIKPHGGLTIIGTIREVEGNNLIVGKEFTTYDNVIIQADARNQGALAQIDATGATPATVIFHPKADKASAGDAVWQYIGVPFLRREHAVDDFRGAWMTHWNEGAASTVLNENWTWVQNEDPLIAFDGYGFTHETYGTTYTLKGNLVESENKTIPLTYTATFGDGTQNENAGWNLIANSWMAPIHLDKFVAEDFGGANATIYVYNSGTYAQWEGNQEAALETSTAGQYITVPVGKGQELGFAHIPPMQGFYVVVDKAATLTLDYKRLIYPYKNAEGNYELSTAPQRTPRKVQPNQSTETKDTYLRISVLSSNNTGDYVTIFENTDHYTEYFDNMYEGRKMDVGESLPYIAGKSEDGEMAVLATPSLDGTVLTFRRDNVSTVEYTLSFDYRGTEPLYLLDCLTNQETQILTGNTYTFVETEKAITDRFLITKSPQQGDVATGLSDIYVANGLLHLANPAGENVTVSVFAADGKLVQTVTTTNTFLNLNVPAAGVYMIQLTTDTDVRVVKQIL